MVPCAGVVERGHPPDVVEGGPDAAQFPVEDGTQVAGGRVPQVGELEVAVEQPDVSGCRHPLEQQLPQRRHVTEGVRIGSLRDEAVPPCHVIGQRHRVAEVGAAGPPVDSMDADEGVHRLATHLGALVRREVGDPIGSAAHPDDTAVVKLLDDEVRAAEPLEVVGAAVPMDPAVRHVGTAERLERCDLPEHVGRSLPAHVRRWQAQEPAVGATGVVDGEPVGEAGVAWHRDDLVHGDARVPVLGASEGRQALRQLGDVHVVLLVSTRHSASCRP